MKKILATTLLSACALTAAAQQTQSGYFNDGYLYRHTMNPAIANSQSYVAFPVLGNINISERGNFGLKDFLYSRGGKTVTFMHPDVSTAEAIKPFVDKLRLENDIHLNLISVGIAGKNGKGYTTVSAGVRSNSSASLPGQFLRLAKEGPSNQTYDLSNLNVNEDVFAEIAAGYSRKVNDNLRVGGKLKVLLGLAHIDAAADGTRLTLGQDQWEATVNAEVNASVKGLTYLTDTEMHGPDGNQAPHTYVDDIDLDSPGLNGFGLALDLGATYRVADMLNFGLAVTDLGFIHWNNNMVASTCGPHSVSTSNYTFSVDKDSEHSFDNEMERLGDALKDIYELQDMGDQGGRTRSLGATINVSAEYEMPFYKKLTVGLLNTTRLQGEHSWNETRLSFNVAPVRWFAFSLTGAAGTFGPSFGSMLSLHPKGFSLYAGFDCLPTSFTQEGVPLSRNFQTNFGIVFPF